MKKLLEWFKKHPLAIVAIVGVVFLLFVLGGNKSSAGAAGPSGPSDAEVQANAAITTAQIAGAAHAGDTNANVAIEQIKANAAMYETDKASSLAALTAEYGRDTNLASISGQIQVAQYAADTNRMQIQATTDQAAITSATYEALAKFQADTAQAGYSYQSARDIAEINANQNVQLAQLNPELEKVKQKEMETDRYYDYKMNKSSGGGGLGGLIGGILSIF